ncbi:alpha-2-macroglobulin-like protein 1 [Denticeps clupeoides]|uniref:alpha-2-macroglobulin-like protein 1 n=1 Tax=Denticeps clupeoides TaxID=299321 RepID=UPI0010A5760E|nr:alpha-2-macroglobulin-like protein 1 [Denticeps clupeoides]
MLWVLLVLALRLQHACSRNDDEPVYLVTVPATVFGGSTETLCITLLVPEGPVSVEILLENSSGFSNTSLLEQSVSQNFYKCLPFQVPDVHEDTVFSVLLTVTWLDGVDDNSTQILVTPSKRLTFIETDKPLYKPGQTIQFRIVSLDTNFLPYDQVFETVEIQDSASNRIAQWLNQSTLSGIVDLSYPMAPEASLGYYAINVWDERGQQTSDSFEIKEYVLPKYDVTVQLPEMLTILDPTAILKVCAKYTYGKPVLGLVSVKVCQKQIIFWGSQVIPVCENYTMTTDKTGCAVYAINVTKFGVNYDYYGSTLNVDCEVTEDGTGVVLHGSGSAPITRNEKTVSFQDSPMSYRPGIDYEGQIKLTSTYPSTDLSSPVANTSVYLSAQYNEHTENRVLTTDYNGLAYFSLDTSLWNSSQVYLKADLEPAENMTVNTYSSSSAQISLNLFYSKSKSFLSLRKQDGSLSCDSKGTINASYIIQADELESSQESLDFYYLVLSRGKTVQHGLITVAVCDQSVNKGELSFSLQQVPDLSPLVQVVVYTVLPGGETVADSMDFPIELCFKNKVSLSFPVSTELPGEKTSLSLAAHPGSLCSVRAVDQSVLLMKPGQELTAKSVFDYLPVQRVSGYPFLVDESDSSSCFIVPPRPFVPLHDVTPTPTTTETPVTNSQNEGEKKADRKKRLWFPYFGNQNDVYSIFKDIGIKILTNSDVKDPFNCFPIMFESVLRGPPEAPVAPEVFFAPGAAAPREKQTVRTYFPETWIWDLVPVGHSGSVTVERTVPDTITTWVADAFCTSPVGFGLAPSVTLTAFQPFFVSLTLPYSVIRGEVFTLKATVFNYLSKCIVVKVTLADSTQFKVQPSKGSTDTRCLCENESWTFGWVVTPSVLGVVSFNVTAEIINGDKLLCGNEVTVVPDQGLKDTVVQTLLVEAEGTQKTVTHNALLCPAESPVEKHISLTLPEVFVEGSEKAFVSVLGDLMGRAMKNLGSLLAMPYGCGEQNMLLFAPNIFILKYLESTNQLTDEIKGRATRFLESGYQRELTYKHSDGSYSAFGNSDDSGNTWLTGFVMKSFGVARPYIFIDPKDITDAKNWLGNHQQESGCIASVGKLFHNDLKGGVSDEISLTAYISAALLELDNNTSDPVIERSLSCLKSNATTLNNTYTTALLFYTFTLAGDKEMRSTLLNQLDEQAIISGGGHYWGQPEDSGKNIDSVAVETSSYVLLALLSGPELDGFGLGYSASIVHWLAQNQNPYGGFSSTQDTVVALQALSLYSAATYSPKGETTVSVSSPGGFQTDFTINQNNRLLYQEKRLQGIPGNFSIHGKGQSCVFVQMAMFYNIPPTPDDSAFNISTRTSGTCNGTKILFVSVDVWYTGPREETNMVIINIKLLSGFSPVTDSLETLKEDHNVKRVDQQNDQVIIYLDALRNMEAKTYSIIIQEDVPIGNLKPATVKIYDYYQISDEAVTEYSSPCAE